jgi:uncharacterized membrane protein YdjX (TVP38/TMEM64 family)
MNLASLKINGPRLVLLIMLGAGIATFFILGGHHAITFETLVAHKDALIDLADNHPILAPMSFVATYLILGIFGLPGSTVLNLTAGVLFDFWKGLLLVMLGSTLASALAFFCFRYLFRSYVDAMVRSRFPKLEEDLEREGAYFVFAMRLFPVIPYSLTNLVLAVSPVRFLPYLLVSLLALLPRYILYVYAGDHLGDVQDVNDLFSPYLIGVLALLALLPWALKRAMPLLKRRFAKKTEGSKGGGTE